MDRDPIPLWTERFVSDLAALSEPLQRELRVVEWLQDIDPAYAVRVLACIVTLAAERSEPARAVMLSLVNLRSHEKALGYQRMTELYRHADDLDLPEVKALLIDGRAVRQVELDDGNDRLEKTLGERKALATSPDRDLIDRLLCDRHPHVIRILLQNRRLVEVDVVRLAAMRPQSVDVLKEIIAQPKWMARYRVRLAVISNPFTPANVAVSLLPQLQTPDLRMIATSSTLSAAVRHSAEKLLSGGVRHS